MSNKWTEKDLEEADRIVNDIAERCDNKESRKDLRRALEMYADKYQELRVKHNRLVNRIPILTMEEIP